MMTDPIADMLTRIRNAVQAGQKRLEMPGSRMKTNIAEILQKEGYILGKHEEKEGAKTTLVLDLKYGPGGVNAIRDLQRVSKPGMRVYAKSAEIPRVLDGLGICIVSTSKGVLSDRQCREMGVGGELLCNVW